MTRVVAAEGNESTRRSDRDAWKTGKIVPVVCSRSCDDASSRPATVDQIGNGQGFDYWPGCGSFGVTHGANVCSQGSWRFTIPILVLKII